MLSDVVGSPLSVIASGPTVPDPTSSAEAFRVLERWGLLEQVPRRVVQKLGDAVREPEVSFPPHVVRVVADGYTAAAAAQRTAESAQIPARILRTDVQGEAREVAGWLVEQGKQLPCPGVAICAGETTVTVRGEGRGGRNQELALAAGLALQGCPELTLLSAGTDGIDGPTPAAGAFADGQTVSRGMERGLDARDYLGRNDAYSYLRSTQDLLVTGPTQTNVGDLMLVLRHPA